MPQSKNKKIIVYVVVVLIILGSALAIFKYSRGITGTIFGGKVAVSFYCACSGNFLMTITPPVGGQFMYYPGTQAYESYNLGFETGMWTLGLYTPGGVCLVPAGKGCVTFGLPLGTITPTVGSSLTF